MNTESLLPPRRLSGFKAYDIRARVPDELDGDAAYRIGRAFADFLGAGSLVVGRDVRLSGPDLAAALIRGITDAGADVWDLGLCGTEMVYFATRHLAAGGGIMVTASHNPADFNGFKLVGAQAKPVSGDSGLAAVRGMAEDGRFRRAAVAGAQRRVDITSAYVAHLLEYLYPANLRPLRVVVNPGNGAAGPILDRVADYLPMRLERLHHEPDGRFPHGVPNPLLPENREATAAAVRRHGADFGVAWDGDFDRCFLFDENGDFIEGYYLIGLLAEEFLRESPGEPVVHDPRLYWGTVERVQAMGGMPVQSKTGHAFMKECMWQEEAVYGAEMSGHHFFRRFGYCDSGMIPWLLMARILGRSDQPLSALVAERQAAYPCSGEINFTVADPHKVMEQVVAGYRRQQPVIDRTDGVSLEFPHWRFNLRPSNTEPLLRLNLETRGDRALMNEKTEEVSAMVRGIADKVSDAPPIGSAIP
ncbi:MAG TPA: phosphomannomutase [Gammaproteobacteria bacterium]|nr:phosphomannomutase [Gammaproteobacteria bacterium]